MYTGRKTITTTHARFTAHGSDKLIKLMETPYENTVSVHDSATGRLDSQGEGAALRGDNLLISNFDNRTQIDQHGDFVSVIHITERYNYTPVEGGYNETVVVQGSRPTLRAAVVKAIDYAREHQLRVQCNNPHVCEDIEAGLLDVSGLLVVDSVQRVIVDGGPLNKPSITLQYSDGRTIECGCLDEATEHVLKIYPDAVFVDDGGGEITPGITTVADIDLRERDGGRVLVWESEEASINDPGSRTIAEIRIGGIDLPAPARPRGGDHLPRARKAWDPRYFL